MGLSAADIAGMQATIAALLPDSTTNSRTTATFQGRMDDGAKDYRLYGFTQRFHLIRAREFVAPANTDLAPGDRLTRSDGLWVVIERIETPSYDLDTRAMVFKLGTAVTATTKRGPASITAGATSGFTTHETLTCWQFFDAVVHALDPTFVADTFGVSTTQIALVICDTPTETEAFPIRPGDYLVIGSAQYLIRSVGPLAPSLTALYVDVPASATPTP